MTDTPYETAQYRDTALRFVKDKPGLYGMPHFSLSADFSCKLCDSDRLCYETEREFVIYVRHFILKDACLVTCRFKADARYQISAVVFEGKQLPFSLHGDTYQTVFEISGLSGPTRTLFTHTILREDGLTLRVEQNDPLRRAGQYREETFPAQQIEASHHYMFAMREIARALSIPQRLHDKQLGYLLILGFETCNTVHTDHPPHWHLIFRWPYFCGSQAPHIYLDEQGRMVRNVLYVDGIQGVSRSFAAGEWCKFVDMYGGDVMAFCIEPDGGMSVTTPGGALYTMSPYREGDGVRVLCNGAPFGKIAVCVSAQEGTASVRKKKKKAVAETIRFDPLTGALQSVSRQEE